MQGAELQNTYFLLRHGRSTANEHDMIVSHLENGKDLKYGLTEVGRQQALAAGLQLREQLEAAGVGGHLCVYTSPFSRTLQTAQLAASQLGADSHIQEAVELRERHFGDYELQSCSNYETVWAADAAETSARPPGGGESVQDVAARMKELIARLERSHQGYQILLVSHGDALSILAAVMLGTDLQSHRQHGLPNCGMLRIPAAQL